MILNLPPGAAGRFTIAATRRFFQPKRSRFQYCLYVPPGFDGDKTGYRTVVAMHGTGRSMVQYRDAFTEFARYNRCVVLAPLFPVGPLRDGNSRLHLYH